MNQLKKLFAVAALTACVLPVAAQYPVIPDSVKIRGEEQQKEIDRKSDEAWAKALPVVMSEAVQGRPYKPWASKPEDLIKSNIPAFPGAEGGGAYTPGGRGGKVIVVNSLADSGPGTLREACETGGGRRMCSSGMMLWEVTVWVMLLSITALPVGDWMKTCLFTAMYTIAIPQGMV